MVKAQAVVCLGATAARSVLGRTVTIGKVRGTAASIVTRAARIRFSPPILPLFCERRIPNHVPPLAQRSSLISSTWSLP
jgi:uracil-DNA glycosylase